MVELTGTHVIWGRDKVKIEKTESGATTTSSLGRRYQYVSSQNNIHTFQYGGYRDNPLETIEFQFDLSLNCVKR